MKISVFMSKYIPKCDLYAKMHSFFLGVAHAVDKVSYAEIHSDACIHCQRDSKEIYAGRRYQIGHSLPYIPQSY